MCYLNVLMCGCMVLLVGCASKSSIKTPPMDSSKATSKPSTQTQSAKTQSVKKDAVVLHPVVKITSPSNDDQYDEEPMTFEGTGTPHAIISLVVLQKGGQVLMVGKGRINAKGIWSIDADLDSHKIEDSKDMSFDVTVKTVASDGKVVQATTTFHIEHPECGDIPVSGPYKDI